MTKREIESSLDDLEAEHSATSRGSLDDALEAMQSDEPAGSFLAPDADPLPVLFPAVDEGFFLVDPFTADDERVRAEAGAIFRDEHDMSADEFTDLREEQS